MAVFEPPVDLQPLIESLHELTRDPAREAYVVGGAVRDGLLRRRIRDLDIAMAGDTVAWTRGAARVLGGHFVLLDEMRGIARVVLAGDGVSTIDVARLRGDIESDLRRRDFTIDALAAPLPGGHVLDPMGGLGDLAAGQVRMVSTVALDEDPLRLLRGVRIASELGFELEASTSAAIRERTPRIRSVAGERRRDELARILALEDTFGALKLLDHVLLFDALLPEVTLGRGVPQPDEHHRYDVFEHGLRAVQAVDAMLSRGLIDGDYGWIREDVWSAFDWCAEELRAYFAEMVSEGRTRGALLKLAALLHDVAKPQTREVETDGRVRFTGHADEGARIAERVMRRYRFSAREIRFVSTLVAEHLRPVQLGAIGEVPTRRALYRFYRDLEDAVPAVLFLALADAAAARGPSMARAGWAHHAGYMNSLLVRSEEGDGIVHLPRLLSGNDIMQRFGLPQGPIIGRLLADLEESQAAGEITDVEGALAFVRAQLRGAERPTGQ